MKNAGPGPTPDILMGTLGGEAPPPAWPTSPPGDSHVHHILRNMAFLSLGSQFGFSWVALSFRPPCDSEDHGSFIYSFPSYGFVNKQTAR